MGAKISIGIGRDKLLCGTSNTHSKVHWVTGHSKEKVREPLAAAGHCFWLGPAAIAGTARTCIFLVQFLYGRSTGDTEFAERRGRKGRKGQGTVRERYFRITG